MGQINKFVNPLKQIKVPERIQSDAPMIGKVDQASAVAISIRVSFSSSLAPADYSKRPKTSKFMNSKTWRWSFLKLLAPSQHVVKSAAEASRS